MTNDTSETTTDPMLEPFRDELLRLLTEPFSVEVATKMLPILARTVNAAQETVFLRNPKVKRQSRRGFVCGPDYMDPMDDGESMMGSVKNDREAFGAEMMRQVVSAVKPQTQSATELVKAIAEARSLGLGDVADALLKQLTATAALPAEFVAVTLAAAADRMEAVSAPFTTNPMASPVQIGAAQQ